MRRGVLWVLISVTLSGCLFKGKPKPPPPVETVEMTRARGDSLWREAQGDFRQGRWKRSASNLDRAVLIMDYGDPRRAKGHFMMGEALLAQQNELQAVREFRKVADENASDALAPDALLRAGDAYASLWRKPELDPTNGETALATYRELLERYPDTDASRRAVARVTALQNQFAAKELRTAKFYLRMKAYDSAILSFRNLVATYPRSESVPEALQRLVETYARLNYEEDLRDTCDYIGRYAPKAVPKVARLCPKEASPPP
jgi:outer membrane protein assembly factor BamD